MKTLHSDLFPETLLVSRQGDRIFTTSLTVATFSKKRHKDVLKAIENKLAMLPEAFSRRNFAPSDYKNERGKTYPMYEITEEGFALTMMGFTGKEAVQWQVEFIEAFVAMRAQLQAREARFSAVLDQVRPYLRPVVEATERGLSRAEIAEPLNKTPGAITYHRGQARRFGLLNF